MTVWLDAQLPPRLAEWIKTEFSIEAHALRELGLRDATDTQVFDAARDANVILMSKDSDFIEMVLRRGPPPRLIWLTCGNVSNAALQALLQVKLSEAIAVLDRGDPIVEIG